MAGGKPNFLIIMADQLAPQFLGCYGHPVVRSPFIDKLAQEGVVFDSAYTNSPLCAPARFVMMSGRLPSKISAWDNAAEFASEIPTFAHYLEAQGYRTCLSGKMHFVGPDQLHGFRERLTTDVYPADFTWHPEWDRPEARLDWFHNMAVVTQAGPCVRSMYMDYDDEVVFRARRYLFERAKDGGDEPFLLTVSMIQPHDPYLCGEDGWLRYEDVEIDLPRVPLDSIHEDPMSRRLRFGYGASDTALDDATLRNARRAYYGAVADIDDKVGELLQTLEQAGFSDNTIVIVTADHGDMLGERGMWFKMSFFENSARVPLIVRAPGMFSNRRVSQSVSLVDLLPTLVELSRDGKRYDYATPVEGRSLLPHLCGSGGHDEVIGEYFAEGTDTPVFMIRRGDRKTIFSESDPVMHFDLGTDPLETNNLAGSSNSGTALDQDLDEIKSAYNIGALKEQVLESQRRRGLLKGVMRQQSLSWDYQPPVTAENDYIRNTMPIYELEKRGRFPRV